MRKKIIILISVYILATSCASKKNYSVLQEYLQSEISDNKNNPLLVEEKIKAITVLKILYGSDKINEFYNLNIPVDKTRSVIIDENDWKVIFNEFKNDTATSYWNSKSFSKIKFELIPKKSLFDNNFLNKYNNDERKIISLSKPIYYSRKKILLFCVSEISTLNYTIKEPTVIIMKKNKGKWVVIDKVYNYILF